MMYMDKKILLMNYKLKLIMSPLILQKAIVSIISVFLCRHISPGKKKMKN